MTSPRRAFILNRTATARAHYTKLQETLRALQAQESEYNHPCAALTRISDQIWDVSARVNKVSDLIMVEGKLAASDWDNKRAAA